MFDQDKGPAVPATKKTKSNSNNSGKKILNEAPSKYEKKKEENWERDQKASLFCNRHLSFS